jgi:hypothetical protein
MKANLHILTIEKKPKTDSQILKNNLNNLFSTPKKQFSNYNRHKSAKLGAGSNFSPDFLRFRRKKNILYQSTRKGLGNKPCVLPKPISSKEIKRFLMKNEERRMMDSLMKDEKKCRSELFLKLNSSLCTYLRSPKKRN